jgi:hypothetical protein
MNRIDGIAENVRHTVHVSAGGSRTDHLALFEIGGTRLSFRGDKPVSIKEGDDLAVVWEPGDKGIHTVPGYHNRTLDIRDHDVRPQGCGGCGCTALLVIGAALVSVVRAVQRADWLHVALGLAAAAVVFALHRLGRRSEHEAAEKLRQVDALLDQPAS